MKISFSNTWRTVAIIIVAVGLILLALGGFLGPVFTAASRPVIQAQEWLSSRYVAIYQILNTSQDENELRSRNIQLENEVAQLQSEIISLQQKITDSEGLEALLGYAVKTHSTNQWLLQSLGETQSPFALRDY